jgi:flagellum-specific ATP synthase
MQTIVAEPQMKAMLIFKKYLSLYEKNKDLILLGAYAKGSDPTLDKAILARDKIREYLMQGMNEQINHEDSVMLLSQLASTFIGSNG